MPRTSSLKRRTTPSVKELKRRLKKAGAGELSVHRGRGTAWHYIEVHRKDWMAFDDRQARALSKVLGRKVGKTNFCPILERELEMVLGLRPMKPICPICGATYSTEEQAKECIKMH